MVDADPLFDLRDRVIVVTGAFGQLGQQFTSALAARGARVVALDARPLDGAPVSFDSYLRDDRVLPLQADVTSRDSLEQALTVIEARWGQPHALINNAGLDSAPDAAASANAPFEGYSEACWQSVLAVNLTGAFLCCQVIGSALARAGRGSIVNIGSIYGLVSPDQGLYEYRRQQGDQFFKPIAYGASKAGLLGLTRYLATYWADRNVRVNVVTFAGVFNNQAPQFLEKYCEKVPLGRMARADEYNGAIIFLCSDASGYMTGSNLVIDGGYTAW